MGTLLDRVPGIDIGPMKFGPMNQTLAALETRVALLESFADVSIPEVRAWVAVALLETRRAEELVRVALLGDPSLDDGNHFPESSS